jgi:two-component system chemotaxis response regulator CheB
VTMDALQIGAVDYISKSSSFVSLDIAEIETELIKKITYWAENYKKPRKKFTQKKHKAGIAARHISLNISPDIVLIGASTGGPKIIPKLFSTLDVPKCPVVIALHMPALYTKSFADHLGKSSGFNVVEGFNGMKIEKDMVVVLPGGVDSNVVRLDDRGYGIEVLKNSDHTIHPSVDVLFLSALKATKRLAGVVLSGMGDDGTVGAIEMNKYGLPVIVQDEESCAVYGMPRAIVEAGIASEELNLIGISKNINRWFASREFNSTAVNGIV